MAASDKVLGDLHALVATVLSTKLAEGEATAAEIGAAIAFLKNNNITASVSDNAELAGLQAALAAKRNARRLGARDLADAQAAFEAMNGGLPQ